MSQSDSIAADFIEVIDNALDAATCAAIVTRFEAGREHQQPGSVGSGVMPELKDSTDILLHGKPQWQDVEQQLLNVAMAGTIAYLRKYPHLVIAPLMLQTGSPLRRLTGGDIGAMSDAELARLVQAVLRPGAINLQRYRANHGGYPYWHCELYPKDASGETLHRHLLWMVYLNDGFAEGETEFLYQGRKLKPKTGTLVLAPAAFTHTHRGNMPRGGDKYIATSWILFQRAERLFQKQ